MPSIKRSSYGKAEKRTAKEIPVIHAGSATPSYPDWKPDMIRCLISARNLPGLERALSGACGRNTGFCTCGSKPARKPASFR